MMDSDYFLFGLVLFGFVFALAFVSAAWIISLILLAIVIFLFVALKFPFVIMVLFGLGVFIGLATISLLSMIPLWGVAILLVVGLAVVWRFLTD